MRRTGLVLAAVCAAGGLFGWLAGASRDPAAVAQQQPAGQPAKADGAEAGIKAITAEYAKAFNAGDAKAASMLWIADGEYIGEDGEVVQGRAAIEKSLAEHFKEFPKRQVEIRVESVRVVGRALATAEGVVTLKTSGDEPTTESRYSAVHILEDGKWLAVSVSEWVPDPATEVTPQQLEWLIGEWTAKGEGGELKIIYAWDEDKAFITGKYTLSKDGKTVVKGTQVLGRNPTGGLRSWVFDSSGTTSDGLWVRDEGRWISDAIGVLPDGTEVTSVNVMVRLDDDSFTWQTTDREVDGIAVGDLPPVKVTRVKK